MAQAVMGEFLNKFRFRVFVNDEMLDRGFQSVSAIHQNDPSVYLSTGVSDGNLELFQKITEGCQVTIESLCRDESIGRRVILDNCKVNITLGSLHAHATDFIYDCIELRPEHIWVEDVTGNRVYLR